MMMVSKRKMQEMMSETDLKMLLTHTSSPSIPSSSGVHTRNATRFKIGSSSE
jgi:hypothetical protein